MNRQILATAFFVIFTVIITWQVATFTRDWTLRSLHQKGSDELLNVISSLRGLLDEYRYLPFLISQNADVNSLVRDNNESLSDEVSLYLEQTNLVAGTSSLFVLGAQGKPLAYSHWRDQKDFFTKSHHQQTYFKQSQQGDRGRQFSLNEQTGQPAYFLSSPIYNGSEFTGAAVVRIELADLISRLHVASTVLLTDAYDRLFITTGPLERFKPIGEQVKKRTLQLSDGVETQLWQRQNQFWLARSVMLDDLKWQVTVLEDSSAVDRNVRNAVLFSFGACFALGLFGLLLRERQLKLRSQHETRQTLARSEAQQKAIINNAQVGLLLIDAQGNIVFANETTQQQFNTSLTQLNGQPLLNILQLNDDSPLFKAISRLDKTGFSPVIGYESIGRRGDGTQFPLMVSIRQMASEHDKQFIVTVIDISKRKALELQLKTANESLEHKVEERTQALKTAQDELIQAGKMAAIGRMSTAVVHELNQPLTAIRNYVAICRQMLQTPELLSENLSEVDQLTQRMALITSQLKTFAYQKPENVQPVAVNMALENALQLFKYRFNEQQVDVKLTLLDDTPYIMGDSARLEQVLVNLVKNALDAMQGESEQVLTIACELISDDQSTRVVINVSDSGTGISESLMPQLFEPFVTSKRIGDGLGLGLAIVKSIVRDLNGDIHAGNNPDKGAYFRLEFHQASPV